MCEFVWDVQLESVGFMLRLAMHLASKHCTSRARLSSAFERRNAAN